MPQSHKIAVVEDNHDLRFMYVTKLELEGFTVRGASNGNEGWEVVQTFRPDLILLDLLLPGMSGAELLARLRAEEWASDIRVIVLTNVNKQEAPMALRFLDVERYIVKAHHTPAQIAQVVRDVFGIRHT